MCRRQRSRLIVNRCTGLQMVHLLCPEHKVVERWWTEDSRLAHIYPQGTHSYRVINRVKVILRIAVSSVCTNTISTSPLSTSPRQLEEIQAINFKSREFSLSCVGDQTTSICSFYSALIYRWIHVYLNTELDFTKETSLYHDIQIYTRQYPSLSLHICIHHHFSCTSQLKSVQTKLSLLH